jgi:hypothetical protein
VDGRRSARGGKQEEKAETGAGEQAVAAASRRPDGDRPGGSA